MYACIVQLLQHEPEAGPIYAPKEATRTGIVRAGVKLR